MLSPSHLARLPVDILEILLPLLGLRSLTVLRLTDKKGKTLCASWASLLHAHARRQAVELLLFQSGPLVAGGNAALALEETDMQAWAEIAGAAFVSSTLSEQRRLTHQRQGNAMCYLLVELVWAGTAEPLPTVEELNELRSEGEKNQSLVSLQQRLESLPPDRLLERAMDSWHHLRTSAPGTLTASQVPVCGLVKETQHPAYTRLAGGRILHVSLASVIRWRQPHHQLDEMAALLFLDALSRWVAAGSSRMPWIPRVLTVRDRLLHLEAVVLQTAETELRATLRKAFDAERTGKLHDDLFNIMTGTRDEGGQGSCHAVLEFAELLLRKVAEQPTRKDLLQRKLKAVLPSSSGTPMWQKFGSKYLREQLA